MCTNIKISRTRRRPVTFCIFICWRCWCCWPWIPFPESEPSYPLFVLCAPFGTSNQTDTFSSGNGNTECNTCTLVVIQGLIRNARRTIAPLALVYMLSNLCQLSHQTDCSDDAWGGDDVVRGFWPEITEPWLYNKCRFGPCLRPRVELGQIWLWF